MLPNAKNAPTRASECTGYRTVPRLISDKLVKPISAIACRDSTVTVAAMPKAAVHKYRNPHTGKDKIGLAKQRPAASPTSDSMFSEHRYQFQFGILVTRTTNTSHHL